MRPWPGGLPPSDGQVPWEERHLLHPDERLGFTPYRYVRPHRDLFNSRTLLTYPIEDFEFVDPYPNAEEILIAADTFRECLQVLADSPAQRNLPESHAQIATKLYDHIQFLQSKSFADLAEKARANAVRTALRDFWQHRHSDSILIDKTSMRDWLHILITPLREYMNTRSRRRRAPKGKK